MAKASNGRGGFRPGAGRKSKNAEGKLENSSFTAEQLKAFVESPHVAFVSRKTVSYTKAFKEAAWARYSDGVDPIQIFKDAGLDTEALGNARIIGFFKLLRKAKACGYEFTEGSDPYPTPSTQNETMPSLPTLPRLRNKGHPPVMTDYEINHLAEKIAYMSQEMDVQRK